MENEKIFIKSFTFSLLFIFQQIFILWLLWAQYSSMFWGDSIAQNEVPALVEPILLWGKIDNEQINI